MNMNVVIQVIIIIILIYILYTINNRSEGLCIKKPYGYITDVPASSYINANMALVHSTSLGQAPLGDPRFWIADRSPITQGMYGLYQNIVPIDKVNPLNYQARLQKARIMPVYTETTLPPQCNPLN